MANNISRQDIINKVFAGDQLTSEEELFYLTEIVGCTMDEAKTIVAIDDNNIEQMLID